MTRAGARERAAASWSSSASLRRCGEGVPAADAGGRGARGAEDAGGGGSWFARTEWIEAATVSSGSRGAAGKKASSLTRGPDRSAALWPGERGPHVSSTGAGVQLGWRGRSCSCCWAAALGQLRTRGGGADGGLGCKLKQAENEEGKRKEKPF